jgi:hypothetical protein
VRGTLDCSSTEIIYKLKERQAEIVRQVMSVSTDHARRERLVNINEGLEEALKYIMEVLRSEE